MDQILRQPQRQRHERTENKEVIEREAPDLNILERFEFQKRADGLFTRALALKQNRIIAGGKIEDQRHDDHRRCPYFGNCMPSKRNHDHRCEKFRDGRADITGAKNTKGRALFFRRIPARDISNANRE